MKGWGKVYICIFDGPGLERGQRSIVHDKRKTKTTAFDMGTTAHQMKTSKHHLGTSAHQMGTAKPYKIQDKSKRKKQDRTSAREVQKQFQERFIKLGGVGIVSPK